MADKIELTNRIVLRSVLPLFKVIYDEGKESSKGVDGIVQFAVKDSDKGAYLEFSGGNLDVKQGIHSNPDVTISFKSVEDMNGMFTGKTVVPSVKGFSHIKLLLKLVPLFLGLTLLMPNKNPKAPKKREFKVKLLMYMVTNALSQLNKGGDEDMMAWTAKMPDRIFQLSVQPEGPAAYLRVKVGKTKSGHGIYTKKAPFIHMMFQGIDGAYAVIAEGKDTVEAMGDGEIRVDGSPESAGMLGSFMKRIESLLMPK